MSDSIIDPAEERKHTRDFKNATPDILEAWAKFDDVVFAAEGREIPLKYRELMAIAVAYTTQCVYCIDFHVAEAKKAGATIAELAEVAWVTAALRGGAAFSHGRLGFKLYGEHEH